MLRATISKIIPVMVRPIPEKNEALEIHQYQGKGSPVRKGRRKGPTRRLSMNRKIPMTMSANPKV
jgi:hypothetical protein